MKLATETFGSVTVVHTPEELGGDAVKQLEEHLTSLDRVNIVVDLNGTENIDSLGLEALLNAQESLRALGGDLKIATDNSSNQTILRITRIDEQLEVYDTVLTAVKSFI
ncbi:MAG: STAS domain-containing protein [Planctomycetaceae bacterium]